MIVWLHFFALARLFQVKIYHVTGGLLILLAAAALPAVPGRVTLGMHQILLSWSLPGFGSALILWGTGLAMWLTHRRLLGAALGTRPNLTSGGDAS